MVIDQLHMYNPTVELLVQTAVERLLFCYSPPFSHLSLIPMFPLDLFRFFQPKKSRGLATSQLAEQKSAAGLPSDGLLDKMYHCRKCRGKSSQ
jgi:hypothetical protein